MEANSAAYLKAENPERNPLGSKKLIGIKQKIAAFENHRVQANWGSQRSGQAQDIFNTKELRAFVESGGNPKEYFEGSENRRIEDDKARVREGLKSTFTLRNLGPSRGPGDSYVTPEGFMTGDKSKAWLPPLSKELQESIQPERVGVFSHVSKFEAKRKAKKRSAKMRNLEKRYVELERGIQYGSNKGLYKDEMKTVAAELSREKEKDYMSSQGFVPKTVDGRSFADIHSSSQSGLMSNESFLMTLEAAIQEKGGWKSAPQWMKDNYSEQLHDYDRKNKGKPWSGLGRAESGLASGHIPNFAMGTSLSGLSSQRKINHQGVNMGTGWFNNPFHRRTAMQTPGLTGMLNPSGFGSSRSWSQTGAYGAGNFAEGMVPSIRASQKREKKAAGRSDVYTKYINTPNFAGYATFNGSERGRERSIVKAHPNPRSAGTTPNFATDFGDIKNALDNLSGQLILFMETLRATGGGAQANPQGSSHQVAMSALNVNVNHSGKLTAQIETIQTQVSLAIERAMKQIAPALWSTIKGPSTV